MSFGFLGEELVGGRFAKLSATDDLVLMQNDLAWKLDRLQWCMMRSRMHSLCRVWYMPPRCFAGLLLKGDAQRWYLDQLRAQYESYLVARSSTMPFWKQIVARSPFQWQLVQDIIAALISAQWQVNDDLYAFLEKLHSDWGTTTPVEVSFQKNRQAERERPDRLVSNLQCWQKPIVRQALKKDFDFEEIDPTIVPEQVGKKGTRIPKSLFSAPTKLMSMKFPDLATHSAKSKNPSFSAESSFILVEDSSFYVTFTIL